MARLTLQLRDLIAEKAGRFTTDVFTGWEAGLQGKRRVGGRLYDRFPPDHYSDQRYNDWSLGYAAALKHRESLDRRVTFAGENEGGPVYVTRKGWGAQRGAVVTQMVRAGCFGTVTVMYWQGSKIVRTVNCGI